MAYNLTNYTSSVNIYDIFVASNQTTNGVFAIFILFTLFIVLFMAMKNYDTKSVFVTSSFLTLIAGILLWALNMVGFWTITIVAALMVGSVIYLLFNNQ